jgi:hypothetical protein
MTTKRKVTTMAKHNKYKTVGIPYCPDGHLVDADYANRFPKVDYTANGVTVFCGLCGKATVAFYRIPQLETKSAKTTRTRIGDVVEVDRVVAWVGYAKNADTVFVSPAAIRAHIVGRLDDLTKGSFTPYKNGNGETPDSAQVWDRILTSDDGYVIRRQLSGSSAYQLRRRAFAQPPVLRDRGLWFRNLDKRTRVTITGAARCWTGGCVSPSGYTDYYGECDYDPGGLVDAVSHNLYTGEADIFKVGRCLIHPADVEGIEKCAD